MDLTQTGTAISGEIFAPQGQRFAISSTDGTTFSVNGLEGSSTCYAFGFYITEQLVDSSGVLVAFSGSLGGRCCGTVAGHITFRRR